MNASKQIEHNLQLESYDIDELLRLFELSKENINGHTLRLAKRKVLLLHPDKSKLPADYFLFYKKAYAIIENVYKNIVKEQVEVVDQFFSNDLDNSFSISSSETKKEFNKKFNDIFEKEMIVKQEDSVNSWFREVHDIPNVDEYISKIKSTSLISFQTKQNIPNGTSCFLEEESDSYVESDMFSKLKFEDLRKVHRDETVIPIDNEKEFKKMKHYSSVDEYKQYRYQIEPLSKNESENFFDSNKRKQEELYIKNKINSIKKNEDRFSKTKKVLSSFHFLN